MFDILYCEETGLYKDYNLPMGNICEYEYSLGLVEELEKLYPILSNNNQFIHFDLHPTDIELQAIKSLQVDHVAENEYTSNGHQSTIENYAYYNYGSIDSILEEVTNYFTSLSSLNQNIAAIAANLVYKIVTSVMEAQGKDSAWTIIRAYSPNNEPYLPRWHTDNCISTSLPTIITLKGSSTLFYNASKEESDIFSSIYSSVLDQDDPKIQTVLYDKLDLSNNQFSTDVPSGSIFLCGESENGAIHTHPPVYESRIFLAIFSGNKQDIQHLKEDIEYADNQLLEYN
jgi:hypothetical protein